MKLKMSLKERIGLRTWHVEVFVAGIFLFTIAYFDPESSWRSYFGAATVLVTFMHAQVSDRLSEKEERRAREGQTISVECYRWERRYFILREAGWAVYFTSLSAWPALGGVVLFLAYKSWRYLYRRNNVQ